MARTAKLIGPLAAITAMVILGLFAWKREEVMRLNSVLTLFEADHIVENFSHMDRIFLSTPLAVENHALSPLPYGPQWALPADVADWVARRNVTGLVVLSGGALVHESYYLGTRDSDRRIAWSVSKSILSALTGILYEKGLIPALDTDVSDLASALKGSAYEGVTLLQVLQMSSGVAFDENYDSFWSDINKMGRVLALGGSMDEFTAGIDTRLRPPGSQMQYVSLDSHVVAMALEGATGRDLPDLMSEYLVGPMGFESVPLYLTDGTGTAFALGGLNMTTRDYARFGQMMANGGIWRGEQVVPSTWVRDSTLPSAPTLPGEIGYGLQWWIPVGWPAGEFIAIGVYGQYIYVNRNLGVVVAVNAADRAFLDPGVEEESFAVLRSIAARVAAMAL